jgi:hypothetical protein
MRIERIKHRITFVILVEGTTHLDTDRIVQEIDAEIARLTSARSILKGSNLSRLAPQHAKSTPSKRVVSAKPTSRLSAAGRRRLSELMKKRWADRRKKAAAKAK